MAQYLLQYRHQSSSIVKRPHTWRDSETYRKSCGRLLSRTVQFLPLKREEDKLKVPLCCLTFSLQKCTLKKKKTKWPYSRVKDSTDKRQILSVDVNGIHGIQVTKFRILFFFIPRHKRWNCAQAGKLTQAPTAKWRSWLSNPRNFKQRFFLHTRGQKANENCEIISVHELYKYPAAKM